MSKGICDDYERATISEEETVSHAVCGICGAWVYTCPACDDYMEVGQRIICKRVRMNTTHKHADCVDETFADPTSPPPSSESK